ncbi:MAG: HAD family hydrolase, partial [Vicinamibacteria bacterium]
VNEMLEGRGRPPLPHDRIRSYVGNGVHKLMERSLGNVSAYEIAQAEALYLSIYRRRLLETTRAYPGATAALEALHRRELPLAVLTNKPVRESRKILDGLGLRRYFRAVYGGDSFERKKPDPMGVLFLLEETKVGPGETLFVGDSLVDLQTARNAGVRSCLVTYGMGALPEDFGKPDFLIDDLRRLPVIV